MKIIAYLKTGCPWCEELKEFFNENNIEFIEKNVIENEEYMDEMVELSGQFKAPTVVIGGIVYGDVGVNEVRALLGL
jgi:glutaredoxin